ncbi:MAG: hypothetical protein QXE98_06145 [Archaeoglobaceae archaeon]
MIYAEIEQICLDLFSNLDAHFSDFFTLLFILIILSAAFIVNRKRKGKKQVRESKKLEKEFEVAKPTKMEYSKPEAKPIEFKKTVSSSEIQKPH